MQPRLFHKISIFVLIVFSLFALIWIGMRAASAVPFGTGEPDAMTAKGPLSLDIKVHKGVIHATVASTTEALARGLSGRPPLPKDSGMLFVFSDAGIYGFWMKDMDFPIDVIWINSDKKVSGIVRGVEPGTYPEVFYPPSEIRYVLELNSGGAGDYGIATGTKLVF